MKIRYLLQRSVAPHALLLGVVVGSLALATTGVRAEGPLDEGAPAPREERGGNRGGGRGPRGGMDEGGERGNSRGGREGRDGGPMGGRGEMDNRGPREGRGGGRDGEGRGGRGGEGRGGEGRGREGRGPGGFGGPGRGRGPEGRGGRDMTQQQSAAFGLERAYRAIGEVDTQSVQSRTLLGDARQFYSDASKAYTSGDYERAAHYAEASDAISRAARSLDTRNAPTVAGLTPPPTLADAKKEDATWLQERITRMTANSARVEKTAVNTRWLELSNRLVGEAKTELAAGRTDAAGARLRAARSVQRAAEALGEVK
ncbi:MAG TPA: hypothetical protein VF681_13190 [Abditibacteriaceae bacterium]